jgi:hypothetical protein
MAVAAAALVANMLRLLGSMIGALLLNNVTDSSQRRKDSRYRPADVLVCRRLQPLRS